MLSACLLALMFGDAGAISGFFLRQLKEGTLLKLVTAPPLRVELF